MAREMPPGVREFARLRSIHVDTPPFLLHWTLTRNPPPIVVVKLICREEGGWVSGERGVSRCSSGSAPSAVDFFSSSSSILGITRVRLPVQALPSGSEEEERKGGFGLGGGSMSF